MILIFSVGPMSRTIAAAVALLLSLSLAIVCAVACPAELAAASSQTPGDPQSWSAPVNVSESANDSRAPALVVTQSGQIHIVWEEDNELLHSYGEGNSWPRRSPAATGEQPALALGHHGALHLVFINEIQGIYNLYYTKWDGASWLSPPTKISNTNAFPDSPDLAVASDGRLHLLWAENGQIYHGTRDEGEPWSYSSIGEGTVPVISAGSQGMVYAAWQIEDETGDYDVTFTRLEGEAWSPPENVSSSPGTDSTAPRLAVPTYGTPHLVWQEVFSATPQVQYAQGPEWTPIITLSHSATGAYAPAFAIDPWGERCVAWEDIAFPRYRIRYVNGRIEDETWTAPATLTQNGSLSQQLEEVSLYPGPDGLFHAAWVETEDGEGEIYYARKRLHSVLDILLPVVFLGEASGSTLRNSLHRAFTLSSRFRDRIPLACLKRPVIANRWFVCLGLS